MATLREKVIRLAHQRPELRKDLLPLLADKTAAGEALLYEPGKRPKPVAPRNGTDFDLKELQKYVGGYIEPVYLRDGRIMVVNEEGLMMGLPPNREASRLAGRHIVGAAVVMDESMMK